MTEPVTVNSGAGIPVAVDDCGASGVAQLVKLAYSADGVATPVTADSDGLRTTLATAIAGERNISSATASYLVVRQECNLTRCDIDTTETLVTAAPCHVLAVIGNDGNTGYTDLIDAAATGGGSTPKARVNAGDGGTVHLYGARFESGLCVDGELSGHDVTILWRPI